MKHEDLTDLTQNDFDDLWTQTQQHPALPPEGFTAVAPLDNFFQDDFFTLLYFYSDAVPDLLHEIRHNLTLVLDNSVDESERATASLFLAERIAKRASNSAALTQNDMLRATKWLEMALELGSVQAGAQLAKLHLSEDHLSVCVESDCYELPYLMNLKTEERENKKTAVWGAYQAWYRGARVALRQLENSFDQWDMPTFEAAFTCILSYLTLLPSKRWRPLPELTIENRKSALSWIDPLWHKLVSISAPLADDAEAYRHGRKEQFQAAMLILRAEEMPPQEPQANQTPKQETPIGPLQVRVVTADIPASAERGENQDLKRFESLREPTEMIRIPEMARIQEIDRSLRSEFPWASEVINCIISDLSARSRHGVLTLGMSAFALVGQPGSGKTRFCQRLSEFLDTPNTVVNMAGMSDTKLFKGCSRGWGTSRPSRIVEFILQSRIANPLFILDEIDKAGNASSNGGDPHQALLDLLEPTNARRYQDLYLLAECDLSHCLYITTANSLNPIPYPVRSRFRLLYFPSPGPEHGKAIFRGLLMDIERSWRLPAGTLTVSTKEQARLLGLPPRQMRHAVIDILGGAEGSQLFTRH